MLQIVLAIHFLPHLLLYLLGLPAELISMLLDLRCLVLQVSNLLNLKRLLLNITL